MKVSIEKELEKVSSEDKQKFNLDPINEVKLLLAGESSEDARILRGLSQNSQFNRIENMRGEQIELENLEKDFDGKVYTKAQIETLCIVAKGDLVKSRKETERIDPATQAALAAEKYARLMSNLNDLNIALSGQKSKVTASSDNQRLSETNNRAQERRAANLSLQFSEADLKLAEQKLKQTSEYYKSLFFHYYK